MKQYKSKEIINFLLKNNFIVIRKKGSHIFIYNEDTEKSTVVPFYNKDLKTGTLLSILKQSGFSKNDLEKC
ncbi:MAG: type II toxin-antitoxin system HicA family toxin [Candidatus Gracilibacteria bacterium]|nr:type II toxin-antitoxin system HicA family toxin [Candidatus Gracilibacteria bacterium]